MNTIVSRALWGTLLAGGITILGATAANAADTSGEDGLLSGTQGLVSVNAPITVHGTAVSLLGDASSSTESQSAPAASAAPAASTSGADGVGSGTQALIDVDLPVNVDGLAVSLLDDSSSSSDAGAPAPATAPAPGAPATEVTTDGADGVASGTQVVAPISIPIDLSGTAVSVIGDANSDTTTGTATPGTPAPATGATTDGTDGVASGTQVVAPISIPIDLSGTAVSVIGDANSDTTTGTAPATGTAAPGGVSTEGSDGIGSGTQVVAPITAPINLGGTAVSVIGDANSDTTTGTATPGAPAPATGTAAPGGVSTEGSDGIGSGTQAVAPISIPIDLSGTAVSVIGDANSDTTTGTAPATGTPAPAAGATTDGNDGIGSGTQVVAPITAPINLGGTAVSVIGDANSDTTGTGTATPGTSAPATGATTDGNDGIGSGTQVDAPITAPINLGGTAVSVIGDANSDTTGTGTATPGTSAPATGATTDGNDGIGSGTQVVAPITAPINLGGTAVSVIGDANSDTTTGSTTPGTAVPGGASTGGSDGIGSGTQILLPISIPISLDGTAISVIGDATTEVTTPAGPGTGPGTDPGTTDPGTTDPGTTNPGTTDPGTTDPGTTDPGTTTPGAGDGTSVIGSPAAATSVRTLVTAPTAGHATLAETGGQTLLPLGVAATLLSIAGLVLMVARRRARA